MAVMKVTSQLPRLQLESMTKDELKDMIPRLLKQVTGREEVFHSRRSARPCWWPHNVHWAVSRADWASKVYPTDQLREIIRKCYRHMGCVELLSKAAVIEATENAETNSYHVSPVKSRTFPNDLFLPFSAEIFICYFCEKEFLHKDKMRHHQKQCSDRPPTLQIYHSPPVIVSNLQEDPPPMSPKKSVSVYPNISLSKYIRYLNLLPTQAAECMKKKKPSLEIDCDLEELEPITPVSPVTPRTPKTLMSQLIHDDTGVTAKKRLSYSLSVDKDKATDQEAVVSDCSSDSESEATAAPRVKEHSLLTIPFSSLLGQRIRKHVHVETPLPLVDNSELYCRTPIKNTFLDKLRRKAPMYPNVYKPRWTMALHKENHSYKFKKSEIREFLSKVNTGLNLKSYKRLKTMKRAVVMVEKTTLKTILRWVPKQALLKQMNTMKKKVKGLEKDKKNVENTKCEFPSGPTLLVKNIDKFLGLKKRSDPEGSHLTLGNYVSEEMDAEVTKMKLTLYKSLLHEMTVLKPTVVVEDIQNKRNTGVENKMPKQGALKSPERKTYSSNKYSPVKPVCSSQMANPDVLKGNNCARNSCGNLSCKSAIQTVNVAVGNMNGRRDKESPRIQTRSVKKTCSPMKEALSPIADKFGSPDDTVSVMSLSSDGESFNSNCCMNCSSKKLSPKARCRKNVLDDTAAYNPWRDLRNKSVMQPITVNVDIGSDMGQPLLTIDTLCGIPSPVSLSSESPVPPTPTKTVSPTTPDKTELMDDSDIILSSQDGANNHTISSENTVLLGKRREVVSAKKSLFGTQGKNKSSPLKQGTSRDLRMTNAGDRSDKSVSPSDSSRKMITRASTNSLPNSPYKNGEYQINTPYFRSQSTQSGSETCKGDSSPYSLKSGHVLSSISPKNRGHESKSFSMLSKKRSLGNNCDFRKHDASSPKRRATLGASPRKLQR